MNDIKLTYTNGTIDLAFGDGGTSVDEGLRTAVLISLFTDRRAEDGDPLPDNGTDRRGWWGDIHPEVDGDLIGSRLWLHTREKQLASVLRNTEKYAAEALQWMRDDGVADEILVVAKNPADGVKTLDISIRKPTGETLNFKFSNYWEAEYAL
jgi:phage gp46-like protein